MPLAMDTEEEEEEEEQAHEKRRVRRRKERGEAVREETSPGTTNISYATASSFRKFKTRAHSACLVESVCRVGSLLSLRACSSQTTNQETPPTNSLISLISHSSTGSASFDLHLPFDPPPSSFLSLSLFTYLSKRPMQSAVPAGSLGGVGVAPTHASASAEASRLPADNSGDAQAIQPPSSHSTDTLTSEQGEGHVSVKRAENQFEVSSPSTFRAGHDLHR